MNDKQSTDLIELAISWMAKIPPWPALILIPLIGLLVGFLLALNPAEAIEIQRRFYTRINWKIEPISMPKEIRNTRLMGLILIALMLAALFFLACYPRLFL